MPIDQSKLDSFRQAAIDQGYDQKAVDSFVSAKQMASTSYEKDLQKFTQDVSSGMPLEMIPQEYQRDVYRGISQMDDYKMPGYSPEQDDVLQRGLYKDKIAITQKENH